MTEDRLVYIVPFKNEAKKSIEQFIAAHSWFLDLDGIIIIKGDGCDIPYMSFSHPNLIWVNRSDRSIYQAWNQGLEKFFENNSCDTGYIGFLGLDDTLELSFVEEVKKLKNSERPNFIGGNRAVYNFQEDSRMVTKDGFFLGVENGFYFNFFHQGSLIDIAIFKDHRFDEKYQLAGDFEFYIRMYRSGFKKFRWINCLQASIGVTGISNSRAACMIYLKEWKLIENELGITVKKPGLSFWLKYAASLLLPERLFLRLRGFRRW